MHKFLKVFLIIIIFLLGLLVFKNQIRTSENIKEKCFGNKYGIKKINEDNSTGAQIDRYLKNKSEIKIFSDYIEIHQSFVSIDENKEIISEIYDLDLVNTSFIALSAYTFNRDSDINLEYRINTGNKWSIWKLLPQDKEVYNPNRKVFGLINIFEDIKKIQFKSNITIEENMVFNLFIP